MEDDNGIERNIEGEKKKQTIQRIKNSMLWVRDERMARELKGIPQREIALFYAFHPEESWGNKIRTQVPFAEEVLSLKKVVKKEDG